MRRWLVIVLGILLFCVVAGAVGARYAIDRFQNSMSKPVEIAVAETIESAVQQSIHSQQSAPGTYRITQFDLAISNVVGPAGESGFEVVQNTDGPDQVLIYGATTSINESEIAVYVADMEVHTVPVVEGGRIELDVVDSKKGITGLIVTPGAFVTGMEAGINNALTKNDLAPVDVQLQLGEILIITEAIEPE